MKYGSKRWVLDHLNRFVSLVMLGNVFNAQDKGPLINTGSHDHLDFQAFGELRQEQRVGLKSLSRGIVNKGPRPGQSGSSYQMGLRSIR